jgi:hypothetical protein
MNALELALSMIPELTSVKEIVVGNWALQELKPCAYVNDNPVEIFLPHLKNTFVSTTVHCNKFMISFMNTSSSQRWIMEQSPFLTISSIAWITFNRPKIVENPDCVIKENDESLSRGFIRILDQHLSKSHLLM